MHNFIKILLYLFNVYWKIILLPKKKNLTTLSGLSKFCNSSSFEQAINERTSTCVKNQLLQFYMLNKSLFDKPLSGSAYLARRVWTSDDNNIYYKVLYSVTLQAVAVQEKCVQLFPFPVLLLITVKNNDKK